MRLDRRAARWLRPTAQADQNLSAAKAVTDIAIGTAVGEPDLHGRSAELVNRQFDQLTPDDAMKPATVQPREGEFDFGPMNQVLDFAVQHRMNVHGHTLVWHKSTPDWFFTAADGRPLTHDPADQALLRARLTTHLEPSPITLPTGRATMTTEGDPFHPSLDAQTAQSGLTVGG